MSFWVYMLHCADESYYIGHTDNLQKRIGAHESGELEGYTSTRRPLRLVFSQEFPWREETLAAERQIKGSPAGKGARGLGAVSARKAMTPRNRFFA